MNHAITIEDISKGYKHKKVISSLNLNVPEGKIYGLLGPSGCGKTTLIKMIIGMLKSDTGKITVLDYQVPHLELLSKIGYMAQSDALYTDLTGYENLQFFAKLYRLPKVEQKKRIHYAAEVVQLTDDLPVLVGNYSGGMMRRLSLAIALIQNPTILILDEPTVGIDPVLKRSIWKELQRLKNDEQKTILITTHVMDEAESCDEIALLRDGQIIATGTPEAVKTAYHATTLDDVFLQLRGEV